MEENTANETATTFVNNNRINQFLIQTFNHLTHPINT